MASVYYCLPEPLLHIPDISSLARCPPVYVPITIFLFFFKVIFGAFSFIVTGTAEEMTGKGAEREGMANGPHAGVEPATADSLNTLGACSPNSFQETHR